MTAREDVSEGAGAVDDQERLADRRELPGEASDRRTAGRAEFVLLRDDASAELHEEHRLARHNAALLMISRSASEPAKD